MPTQICTRCEVKMLEDWNLAPTESDKIIIEDIDQHGNAYVIERNLERIYKKNVYLCDDCYDYWCTKHDIQPLERQAYEQI